MKKTLAIILAVIMIVACTASSMFAAEKDPNDGYWYLYYGHAYAPFSLGDTPMTGFAVSFDLRFEERHVHNFTHSWGLGTLTTLYDLDPGTPYVDFSTYMIGVDQTVIPYEGDWEQGVWYHFVFDNSDGATVKISCDGAEVGTIEETLSSEFGFMADFRDVSIDNIVTYRGPITYFTQDFNNQDAVKNYLGEVPQGLWMTDATFLPFNGEPNETDAETEAPADETTAEGETEAPETEAPATDAPATDAPATEAPATDAPATEAPATDAPATDAPATDAPATEAPATDAPATAAPSTEKPSSGATQTSDIAIASAAVLMAAAAAVVFGVSKKRG